MSESDFERIDLDPGMDEARYHEKPDYAQAIFHNIAEVYPTDAHIVCDYNITPALVVSPQDFIGLFRVGWKPSDDPVCYQWSPMPSVYKAGDEFTNRVVFQAHYLPKDDGEFYQFCYVSGKRNVRGASTPFQFKRPMTDDYVEVEEDDLMMVKTRTAALMEDLNQALTERAKIEKQVKMLEAERDGLLSTMVQCNNARDRTMKERDQLKEQLDVEHGRYLQVEKERDSTTSICDSLREKLDSLTQEKSSMEKKIEEKDEYISSLQEKIKALISEKDALTGKNKMLEQEKELFKNHFTSTESNMQKYLGTIEEQRKKLADQQETSRLLVDEIEHLRNKLEEEVALVASLSDVKTTNQTHIVELAENLRHAEDKLSASEAMVSMMKTETLAQKQVITKMSSDLEVSKSDAFNASMRVTQLEKDHKDEKTKWLDDKAALEAQEKELRKENTWLQSWYAEQLKEHKEEKGKWLEEKEVYETKQKTITETFQQTVERQSMAEEQQAKLNKQLKEHKVEKTRWLDERAELQAAIKAHEKELGTLSQKVEALSQQAAAAEIRTEEEKGSLYALQTAQTHLRDRYAKMKAEYTEMKKENEALRKRMEHHQQQEDDLRREVTDLKERLFMGAEEYKTKYLEARKLESEIRKLSKQLKRSASIKEPTSSVSVETETVQCAVSASSSGTQTPTSTTSTAPTLPVTLPRIKTSEVGTFSRVATADVGTVTRQPMADASTTMTKWPAGSWSGEESFEITDYPEVDLKGLAVAMTTAATSSAPASTTSTPLETPVTATADMTAEKDIMDQEKLVEDLSTEVTQCKAKQQKYKQLYHNEKQKIAVLQKYYYSEVERRDEEMAEVVRQHHAALRTLEERIDAQKFIIDKQRQHIEQFSSEHQGSFEVVPGQVPSLATPPPRPVTPQSYTSPVQMPSPTPQQMPLHAPPPPLPTQLPPPPPIQIPMPPPPQIQVPFPPTPPQIQVPPPPHIHHVPPPPNHPIHGGPLFVNPNMGGPMPVPAFSAAVIYPSQALPNNHGSAPQPGASPSAYPAHFNPFSPSYNQVPPLRYGNPYETPVVRYPPQQQVHVPTNQANLVTTAVSHVQQPPSDTTMQLPHFAPLAVNDNENNGPLTMHGSSTNSSHILTPASPPSTPAYYSSSDEDFDNDEDENNNHPMFATVTHPNENTTVVVINSPPSTSSSLQVPDTTKEADTTDRVSATGGTPSSLTQAELDQLVEADDAPPALEMPLRPLPAPIQPTILPIAKMAAVKCLNERGRQEGLNMFLEDNISDDDFHDDEGPLPPEPVEPEEERFHDADGEPQKLCPACNMTFPADFPQHVFEAHVDAHYGPVCPMCHEQFNVDTEQNDFEAHVQSHFANE